MIKYTNWQDVPENLKTKTALKGMGLKLKRGQKPVAVKTHWHYKIPDYDLYDVAEAVPNVVTDAQRAAVEKAQQKSLEKRTCTRCGWVEELGKHYRGKPHIRAGLCPNCWELEERGADRDEAVEWARAALRRPDVLILDTETTDLYGEIIELALVNLRGEVVYQSRFNPVSPISEGAQAVHGLTAEMLAGEPRFADEYPVIRDHLTGAGQVLIYNMAFDKARLRHTCEVHGVDMPRFKAECLMEWYAQYVNNWSNYHESYRWQALNGGHSAVEDCFASLEVLREMAEG